MQKPLISKVKPSGVKIWKMVDRFDEQLKELFLINNPSIKFSPDFQEEFEIFRREMGDSGNWVYYPWSGALIHILDKEGFDAVRTNRNKNLITAEEQTKLANFCVGILGLSIGNAMALNFVHSGISDNIKLADFDALDLSNLNRIRSGLHYLGSKKTEITAGQIYEINPYVNLTLFEDGVNMENLHKFIYSNPRPNLVLEAIDDFEMKIRIRIAAKEAGIPVVMLTNLGDQLLVDIERYDLDKNLPIFNGLIGNSAEEILGKSISEDDKKRYALSLVGKENVPEKAVRSLQEVNKTLVGRPQLMSTVSVSGGIAALIVRKIALGESEKSGRKLLKLTDFLP